MDPTRSQRFGKPYYRSNYMPPNARQTLEDRLHPPGISTSSNSSWTFSNSHCDVSKPRKGRLCGIFLIGAVLVVALAVIAIGGLAFYIGGHTTERHHHISEHQTINNVDAKRQFSNKPSETTQKSIPRRTLKTPATTAEISSTESSQKIIPEGAILGMSETMKHFNKGSKNKKKEEPTTTEMVEELTTQEIPDSEEQNPLGLATENIEIVPEKPSKSSVIKGSFKVEDPGDAVEAETKYEAVNNGHARPPYSVATTGAGSSAIVTPPNVLPPKRDYSDEPWRPIIPSYRDTVRIHNPYGDQYKDKIFEHRNSPLIAPVIENDSPITFSRESYEQNLRITPEYTGSGDKINLKNNQNSRISDEIAVKYKDLVEDHSIGSSEGIADVFVISGDIVTDPPSSSKPSDVIIISESSTSSTLSTYYNATEDPEIDAIMKPAYPIGVDQIISGISVIESSVETSSAKATTKNSLITATKILIKTTPKTITNVTEKQKTTFGKTVTTTTATTPKTTVTSYATTNTTAASTKASTAMNPQTLVNKTIPSNATNVQPNASVINPFLDDSRSSSSKFNFGIPDLPILKQFHNLDSLLKSFSKEPVSDSGVQFSKYFVRSEDGNETTVTRFPVRTKQTTVKSYKADDTIFVEVSTILPEEITRTNSLTRKPVIVKGEVEVVSGPVKQETAVPTTEIPKLITLLPVRSNVNMMRPLRPRPKSNVNNTITITNRRKSKMSLEFRAKEPRGNQSKTSESLFSVPNQQHQIVNDENGKRWVYYSSSKSSGSLSAKDENLFIVTPEPKTAAVYKDVSLNLTKEPLHSTIETLLNLDYRNREGNTKNFSSRIQVGNADTRNTSEIVSEIVKIVENVAISTGDSTKIIVKKNQPIANETKELSKGSKNETKDSMRDAEVGMSTKAVSSHYKLNQAGVPVLTKVLNKVPAFKIEDTEGVTVGEALSVAGDDKKNCGNNSIRCGNGTCLPASKKCNQFIDCADAADERNCTCAEHLKAQKLHRKLCDGVVDCWDFTDEFNCDWCQEEFLCSNSKVCIRKDQICDGTNNCPYGDDERNCVTVSPSKKEAETFNYHYNGYLMIRKNGRWGKLCIDNFDTVSLKAKTGWKISDLGRTVCKALTFKDFDKVERMISVPNEGRSVGSSETEKYYELAYNEVSSDRHFQRDSVLSFHETDCAKKEVVKVTCTDLECGLRPQATSQWSRIVGGGNAGPGSWPWQAALYKEGEFQCGGTLISENWLISAGHCFYHNQDAYWVVRLGTLRTILLLPSPYEQLRQISKIILHPQYVDNGFINDISLLRMRDPVKFTDYVRPICLPKPHATIVDGTMCTVVGWGQLSEVGWVFPDTLQEVQLPILSSNECRKRTLFLPLYKISDDMFCAGYDRGGRDACLGDSGGPLMCPEANGKWSLYGVTSNGYGCARSNRPGVYTKVSKYLHWVRSQMNLHSESLTPLTENEDRQNPSTSRSFTENDSTPTPAKKNQETEYVIKLISQRVSNVKLSSDSLKSRDKCKGHRCPLGECLPKSRLCNGHIECSDGSDEKDCW